MKRVITFGTFDLFHIGHLNILKRAKEQGDYLIVGVSSDELNKKKGKINIISLNERIDIVKSIKYVDEVFIEDSLELKDQYIKDYRADVLVMGDDWKDKFNWVSCQVLYLERTPNISTTLIKNLLSEKLYTEIT
jgi:glycerol-3-phosphate cytidylyltransferase